MAARHRAVDWYRLLDRHQVYTEVTWAQRQAPIVGDKTAAKAAGPGSHTQGSGMQGALDVDQDAGSASASGIGDRVVTT